jgi:type I restriction enzyme, S subunit
MSAFARWQTPLSWEWVAIEEIARVTGGGTPSTSDESNFTGDGIPWLTPADLTGYEERYIARGARDITAKGLSNSSAKLMPAGTVLFSSRAPIGYCAIASNPVTTNQGFKSLTLVGDIDPEFTYWYLRSAKDYVESQASGTTFAEISGSKIKELAFPLPPLAEQRRIVEKLDNLTAASREAATALTQTETLITRYKAAVLAAAFAAPSQLCRLSDLIKETKNGMSKRSGKEGEFVNVLRLADFADGAFKGHDPRQIKMNSDEIDKYALAPGDIVIVRVNGSEKIVGRAIVWKELERWALCDHFIRIGIDRTRAVPDFVVLYMNSLDVRRHIELSFVSTSGQKTVNQSIIGNIQVPLPPKKEQAEIVSRIEAAFAQIDTLARAVAAARARLSRLDRAILARAFRGDLVPQDPNDEPASDLLKRVKAAAG